MSATTGKSIIVAGATGAIGRELIVDLVADASFTRIVGLSRSSIPEDQWTEKFPGVDVAKAKGRLEVVGVEWEGVATHYKQQAGKLDKSKVVPLKDDWESGFPYKAAFSGHQFAAMCMGTTRSDAGGADPFIRCDLDYVAGFHLAVREFSPDLEKCSQVSSEGANSGSCMLYLRTKGLGDDSLVSAGFKATSLFRPGILRRKDKARLVERMVTVFGLGMPVENVAAAIVADINGLSNSPKVTSQATQNNGRVFGNGGIDALNKAVAEQVKAKAENAVEIEKKE